MTDEKTGYKILEYFAVFVIAMCVLFKGCGTDERELGQLQDDTNRTVGNLKVNSANIGVEIRRSQDSIAKSKEALTRAEFEIRESRELSNNLEAGVNELERLIREAQELARRSADIVNSVDKPN